MITCSSGHEGEPVADREEAAEELLRHLHPRGHLLVLLRVAEQHRDAEREVGDVGEGPAAADHQRSERREHLTLEESLDLLSLLGAGVAERDHPDSVLGEAWAKIVREAAPQPLTQLRHPVANPVDHLARRHPVRSPRVDLALDRLLEPGDSDHEELVEVVLVDRGELEPLQQREARILGQLKDTIIEVEPGELAVEVEGAVGELGLGAALRRDSGGYRHLSVAGGSLPPVA